MSKLKEVRMKAGFSRPDIYRLIGIPVRTQENWESGARTIKEWEEKLIIEKIERLAKMKKYEIRKNTAEVKYRDRFDIKKGVTLLMSDSTNALSEGISVSESRVDENLGEIFRNNKKNRIILATFASNIYRLKHIIEICRKNNNS